jgi:hypothetical protein
MPINFAPVLRIRKYFFLIRLRGAVNPNYGSDPGSQLFTDPAGSVSYLDIFMPNGKICCKKR